ncbi:MAG: biotin/lipoyl-binding protein, partial [Balneolaceae bacterium]
MKNKIYLFLFLGIAFIFQSCGEGSGQGEETFTRVTPSVEAVQAQYGSLPLEERLSGIVRPKNQVDIYPRINAPVDEVLAEDGDQVNQGDVLVILRDNEYREQLRQAEANLRINKARERQALAALNEVESQVRRQRVLDERELSSDLEREQLQAELESA